MMATRDERSVPKAAPGSEEAAVVRRVFRRIVWFVFVLFIFSYLDRINTGFGALSMNKDLGLSATMFGIANSVFYIAYIFAEVPSNLMMHRVGARLWIPRIMITWGIASTATMFAVGPNSLYAIRFMVGLAEAGFVPAVLLYMTLWLPRTHLARASSIFIMAQPVTLMFGSTLSGRLLDADGLFGLAGWRWLFLVEGLPSIILGVVAYFYLADRPTSANWLSSREKNVLEEVLARESAEDIPKKRVGFTRDGLREALRPEVLLLGLVYLGLVNTLSANSTWVPQIVRGVLPNSSFSYIGLVSAIPPLITILVMPLWSARSDRLGERTWHIVCPMLLAALGWVMIIALSIPSLRLLGLVFCSVGAFCAQGIFWTLPMATLAPEGRPVGLALVNTIGLLGSAIGPSIIGALRDLTGSFTSGLIYVIVTLVMAALCVVWIGWRTKRRDEVIGHVAPAR
jgi:ACS family 4-hydroxyphenylacetate permease-like MFS transporter